MCVLVFTAVSSVVVIIIAVFVSSVILLIGIICIKWLASFSSHHFHYSINFIS